MTYRLENNHYKVLSSKGDKEYDVNMELTFCSCPSRKYPCKHLLFMRSVVLDEMAEDTQVTKNDPVRADEEFKGEKMKTNELSEKLEKTKTGTIQELIESKAGELQKVMTNNMTPKRLIRIILTSIRLNPKLAQCTQLSLLGAIFTSAELGLEPIHGLAHLVPFKNKGTLEVVFIVGYQGLVDMFYRHESALSIDPHTVYENDEFDYAYGTKSFVTHRPASKDRGKPIGYYVVAKMRNGGELFKYMSYEEVLEYGKKHSKSCFDGNFSHTSPWHNEFNAMGKKTVIRQISKTLPLSIATRKVLSADETTKDYKKGVSVFDTPDKTDWSDKAEDAEFREDKPRSIKQEKKPKEQPSTPPDADSVARLKEIAELRKGLVATRKHLAEGSKEMEKNDEQLEELNREEGVINGEVE